MGGDMVDREHGVGLTESDWILLDPSGSCWIRAVPSRSEADRLWSRESKSRGSDLAGRGPCAQTRPSEHGARPNSF